MIVQLTKGDRIVHQVDTDHPSGVPTTWAILHEPDTETYSVLYREQDDEEPWHIDWRGSYNRCRARYVEMVTEGLLGDALNGLPITTAPIMPPAALPDETVGSYARRISTKG